MNFNRQYMKHYYPVWSFANMPHRWYVCISTSAVNFSRRYWAMAIYIRQWMPLSNNSCFPVCPSRSGSAFGANVSLSRDYENIHSTDQSTRWILNRDFAEGQKRHLHQQSLFKFNSQNAATEFIRNGMMTPTPISWDNYFIPLCQLKRAKHDALHETYAVERSL